MDTRSHCRCLLAATALLVFLEVFNSTLLMPSVILPLFHDAVVTQGCLCSPPSSFGAEEN